MSCCYLYEYPYPEFCKHSEVHNVENDPCQWCGGSQTTEMKGCKADAEYGIWNGPTPYDITESCVEHVGYLLSDGECRVWKL